MARGRTTAVRCQRARLPLVPTKAAVPTDRTEETRGMVVHAAARRDRDAALSRAIRLTPTAALRLGLSTELVPQASTSQAHVLPVIGEIAAGGPIEAYQHVGETVAVPDLINTSAGTYVLRVRGDSMVDAHIMDGDLVVIREQQTARDGDIVVAQVEENAVTLKRFFKERDRVRLQPANETYEPQFYDDVRIQGKLVGVIRRVD